MSRAKPILNLETHDEPVVRIAQVSRYLGVDKRTVLKWVRADLLVAYPLPGRGEWRINLAELRRFIEAQRLRAAVTVQDHALPRTSADTR